MTIRVVIQQPALPSYRVPVFAELSRRPGINLTLLYADDPGITNVQTDLFDARHVPLSSYSIAGQTVHWHRAQFSASSLNNPHVAVFSWSSRFLSLPPALLLAKARNVGTVLWGHGYSKLAGGTAGLRAWGRRRITTLADATLFYNRIAAEAFKEATNTPPNRVYVALNALDQTPIAAARQRWLDDRQSLEEFARQHRLKPGPNVVFVSRLYEDNRIDMLINAMANLTDRFPHAKTIIIGKGPDQPRLEQLAKERNIADKVIFTGPIYDDQQLAPWMLSASIFCYPVNIGLSILHAFGYGLPVLTSDKTDAQNPEIEALKPGENGATYKHNDQQSLTDTIATLLADEPRRAAMSKAALHTVAEEFSLKTMVDGMEAAIRYAADKHARKPKP